MPKGLRAADEGVGGGKFSGVWSLREFNKKLEGRQEALSDLSSSASLAPVTAEGPSAWTDDSFPWHRMSLGGGNDDEPLLPSTNLVPLFDAYEDLHDSKLACTVPGERNEHGENVLLDRMS